MSKVKFQFFLKISIRLLITKIPFRFVPPEKIEFLFRLQ